MNEKDEKKQETPPLLSALQKSFSKPYKIGVLPPFLASLKAVGTITENPWDFLRFSIKWVLIAVIMDFVMQYPYSCYYSDLDKIFPCINIMPMIYTNLLLNIFIGSMFAYSWVKLVYVGNPKFLMFKFGFGDIKASLLYSLVLIICLLPVLLNRAFFVDWGYYPIFITIPVYLLLGIVFIAPLLVTRYIMVLPAKALNIKNFSSKDSWRMTKRNFFRILLGYMILLFFYIIVMPTNPEIIIDFIKEYKVLGLIISSILFKWFVFVVAGVLGAFLAETYKFLDIKGDGESGKE